MFVYVAGKYSAPTEEERQENVNSAMAIGVILQSMGHYAIVPHLSHYLNLQAQKMGIEINYDVWIKHGLEQLAICDVMLVISESPGVKREIEFAKKWYIPILYDIEDIPKP